MSTVPSVGINRIMVIATYNAILMTVGDITVDIAEDPIQSRPVDRWHQTLSLSPSVALQLHQLLTRSLSEYVVKYGAISEAPDGAQPASRVVN